MRRRRRLRRLVPWLAATAFVALVALFVYDAVRTDADQIVADAAAIRLGDADNGVARNPIAALDMLERLLEREPDHYDALLEAARCWADLRNHDKAIEKLELAAIVARAQEDVILEVRALRQGVNYHIANRDFEDAIEWAQTVAELQPRNKLFALNHGLALYNASLATQEMLLRRFVPLNKVADDEDVLVEQAIESFVSDLWGDPDPDEVIDVIAPGSEESLREEVRTQLVDARRRFLRAADAFEDYADAPGFDQGVARGYVDLLRRSGRIYDAHIEAAIALRQPTLAPAMRRSMLETQALCSLAMDEYGEAAECYEAIVEGFRSDDQWPPPPFVHSLIETRVNAEDWDWILANHADYADLTNNDILLQYAHARALAATGNLDGAVAEIQEPFSTVSLGTRMPLSVRSFPTRRRDILVLAYELYDASGRKEDALTALDALVENFPHDDEGLTARIDVQLGRNRLELAMEDAFDLLTVDRRRPEDFQRWLDIADELSVQRYDLDLEERAVEIIEKDIEYQSASAAADFESSRGRPAGGWDGAPVDPAVIYLPKDPALAWTLIRERIPRNQLERARNDLRQLTQAHPQVQEFRLQLGKLLVRQGLLESAVAEFTQILEDVPSDTEVLDLLTRILFVMGHSEEAAELVNRMILQDPLGVGAVRYGQQLLERGRAAEAEELIKRLLRWPGFKPGRDLFIMSGRAFLALGEIESATAVLVTLSNQYPQNEDVALLGLEVGLASGDLGVISSAIAHLQPMVTGLLPDQVGDLAWTLLESEYYEELLQVMPPQVRGLPVLRPALRPLAEAAKAMGDVDGADQLLASLDDEDSLRDRFLLLALAGRTEEASRRLRLSSVRAQHENDLEACLLAASSMTGFQSMYDLVPVSRLRELELDQELDNASLELLDAALRIAPDIDRLEDVVPPGVVDDPRGTFPNAGPDVELLLEALEEDPERTAESLRAVTLLLLANDRPFWWRETRFLGEQVLDHLPGLNVVSRHLAQHYLDVGLPAEALDVLKRLLTPEDADPRTLEMFMEATRAFGHDEWGIAMAYEARGHPAVRLVLAENLRRRGYFEESLPHYLAALQDDPEDADALGGVVQVYARLGRARSAVEKAHEALEAHPRDEDLADVCLEAVASLQELDEQAVFILERLSAESPDNVAAYEPLARHYADAGDRASLEQLVEVLAEQLRSTPVELWSEEAEALAGVARRVARIVRFAGLRDESRLMNNLTLQLEPGSVAQFRELASLEMEDGRLEIARRYLEVLSIVRPYDRDAPLTLARLLFEQVGQPHIAADVIRRTYGQSIMPPSAVEVLAAEAYLKDEADVALQMFRKISHHPQVTPDTFLTVGRIAFAAGLDGEARNIFNGFLAQASPEHPARGRVNALLALCAPGGEPATSARADGGEPTADRPADDEPEAAAATRAPGGAGASADAPASVPEE